jgi:hypothetical protein
MNLAYYLKKARNLQWLLMFIFSRFSIIRYMVLEIANNSSPTQNDANSVFKNIDIVQIVEDLE